MSQFYARYVPPIKQSTSQNSPESALAGKRKRVGKADGFPETTKHGKKRRVIAGQDDENRAVSPEAVALSASKANGAAGGENILDKYSISNFAKSQNGNVDVKLRNKHQRQSKGKTSQHESQERGSVSVGATGSDLEAINDEQEIENKKHTNIFNRYEKSKRWSEMNDDEGTSQADATNISDQFRTENIRGLVPIPQPENVGMEPKVPAYSTLPAWQAAAINAAPPSVTNFESLGLSSKVLSNLKAQGIEQAFTIQSTVIPLLISGPLSHRGDLCVSAATGSGKTLAYIVPIIESLRKQKGSGLRAVIVVPTRELVKQVRETCETCAAGSNLSIVAALGSRSLLEEQKTLVTEEEIYDPQAYQEELNTPIDWVSFSLEKTIQKARVRDPHRIKDYVTRRKLKADVLITTPGRLVDHLQSTEGFHLDDVQWLVVDEADRLLNESYQEWIDVVVPALKSRRATKPLDKVLSHMRMELPPRVVRKVLLSATMTRDISSLNRIGLNNPRLIVLESTKGELNDGGATTLSVDPEEPVTNTAGKYTLPTTLHEVAATFKEGTDKPLLLLQILKNHVKMSVGLEGTSRSRRNLSKTSPDSDEYTSSSGSDSDSSSTSETADSNGDDDSDSSSTSSSDSEQSFPNREVNIPRQDPHPPPSYHGSRVLVFTRSTASASRLSRLLSLLSPALSSKVATLTRSTMSSAASRKALSSFRNGKSPILIATDRASRGIDVPGLEHVISYDIPGSALTYVHRVGRTARAGRAGQAWTLVEHREGRWFWNEIGGKSDECMIERDGKVKKMNMAIEDEELRKKYDEALQMLGSEVRGE